MYPIGLLGGWESMNSPDQPRMPNPASPPPGVDPEAWAAAMNGETPPGFDPTAWAAAMKKAPVAQALLGQSVEGPAPQAQRGRFVAPESPFAVLGQMAQGAVAGMAQQQAQEGFTNARMGLNATNPAFDDQGLQMPRAPGMAQADPWDALMNFFGPR